MRKQLPKLEIGTNESQNIPNPFSPKITPSPHPAKQLSVKHSVKQEGLLQPIQIEPKVHVCTICGAKYNENQYQKYLNHINRFHNGEEVLSTTSSVISSNKTFIRSNKIFISELHKVIVTTILQEYKILLFFIKSDDKERVVTPIFLLKDTDMYHLLKEIIYVSNNRFDFNLEHKFKVPYAIYTSLKLHIIELYKDFITDYNLEFQIIYDEVKENLSKIKEDIKSLKDQINREKDVICRNIYRFHLKKKEQKSP